MFKLKVPTYEDPYERFFMGRCELTLEDPITGASCNAGYLWHVVQLPDHFFPLEIEGRQYSRLKLIGAAAFNFAELFDHVPRECLPEFLRACGVSEDEFPVHGHEER